MNEGLTLLIAIYRKIDNSTKTDNTMLNYVQSMHSFGLVYEIILTFKILHPGSWIKKSSQLLVVE